MIPFALFGQGYFRYHCILFWIRSPCRPESLHDHTNAYVVIIGQNKWLRNEC